MKQIILYNFAVVKHANIHGEPIYIFLNKMKNRNKNISIVHYVTTDNIEELKIDLTDLNEFIYAVSAKFETSCMSLKFKQIQT